MPTRRASRGPPTAIRSSRSRWPERSPGATNRCRAGVDALIGDRLARLDERAVTLVPWIAAVGRAASTPRLLAAAHRPRHRSICSPRSASSSATASCARDDNGDVDFAHDLVRTAAYKRLSPPRRAMVHARIAPVLAARPDPDDSLAADAARHADAGGDCATCAAACVRAARRCVRLLAYRDAEELVALGRSHAGRLAPRPECRSRLELIHVLLHPGIRLRDPGELRPDLTELCAEAQRLGLDTELSTGLHLLARAYHWGWGDIPRAGRAAPAGRQRDREQPRPGHRAAARRSPLPRLPRDRHAPHRRALRRARCVSAPGRQLRPVPVGPRAGRGLARTARRGPCTPSRRAIDLAAAGHRPLDDVRVHGPPRPAGARSRRPDAAPAGAAPSSARWPPSSGEGSERRLCAAAIAALRLTRRQTDGDSRSTMPSPASSASTPRFLVPDLLGIAAECRYRGGDPSTATAHAARGRMRNSPTTWPALGDRAGPCRAGLHRRRAGRGDEAAGRHLQAVAGRRPPASPATWQACAKRPNALDADGASGQRTRGDQWR